jgi:hypothetical protein
MRTLTASSIILMTAAFFAQPGLAQSRTECIPEEFAAAMFGRSLAKGFLWPGSLPPETPFKVGLPKGARLIGSSGNEEHLSVYVSSDLSSDAVLDYYRSYFHSIDWTQPPMRSNRTSGFVEADPTKNEVYCGPGEEMSYVFVHKRESDTLIRLTFNRERRHSVCDQRLSDRHRAHLDLEQRMPLLTPPNGKVNNQGGSGGSDYTRSSIELSSDHTLGDLQAHFTEQLEEQGWIAEALSIGTRSQNGLWLKEFEDGEEFLGFLILIQGEPDTIRASFEVNQLVRQ